MIDLSVIIPTYNHEKYIEKAIKSVLMQKVNFNMEVLIGEDCSTDHTREILKQIEPNLPTYFHIIYRDKNIDKGQYNFDDLHARMKGRYYITLEGDDYWLYENKLQEQYDFLESHKEYLAVAHNVIVVNGENERINKRYPECKKNDYDFNEFMKGILPGQNASIMYRNWYLNKELVPEFRFNEGPGDIINAFKLAANGKTYCIQKKWSAYRYVISSGSSYSATVKYDYSLELNRIKAFYEYAVKYCNKNVIKGIENKYCWYLLVCLIMKKENIGISEYINFVKNAYYKKSNLLYCIKKGIITPFKKIKYKLEITYEKKMYK